MNTYTHYRGYYKNGFKEGKGEYKIFIKKKNNNKGKKDKTMVFLEIVNCESQRDKIVFGELETSIEPYGRIIYKGSFNSKFEMHGSGSIFMADEENSHIWTGYWGKPKNA